MTRVAAVLVTSNSERWLEQTLASVVAQTRQPDEIVIIDDRSTDGTRDIIERTLGDRARVHVSRASSTDLTTRIAGNFREGLKAARGCDIAVLGDHDDVWHADRIAHQVELMEVWAESAMLASDGSLVDVFGNPVPGTLRDTFPVPRDFNELSPADQMRAVIRRSVATGGASAVRPSVFADLDIPEGWLHDRWWSLVAASREELRLNDETVIDYRISPGQEVGLNRGHQARSVLERAGEGAKAAGSTAQRMRDLQALSHEATAATAPELRMPRLLRNLL